MDLWLRVNEGSWAVGSTKIVIYKYEPTFEIHKLVKAKATPGDEANVYEIRNVHSTDGVVTQSIYKNGSLVLNKDLDQMFA